MQSNGESFQSFVGQADTTWLIYLLIILAPALLGLALRLRRRPLAELRNAGIWFGIGLVLLIGYSFRDELGSRLMGELLPHRGTVGEDGSVTFRVGEDGHFHVEAMVNGSRVMMLVDTGASDVVLSPKDARRLGYDLNGLAFDQETETANGIGRAARVTLREVGVGGVTLGQVSALVIETEMSESLLGMSFLSRLSGFEFSGDRLTLRR